MKQVLSWVLGVPAALVLIAFAVANRAPVTVSFDPISRETPAFALNLPLWAVLFGGIFIGLVIGWVVSWIGQGKWRREAREARSELREEVAKRNLLKKKLGSTELVPTTSTDHI